MKKFWITLGIVLLALTFWPTVILLIVARAKGWKRCGDIAECAEAEGTCGRTSTLTPTAGW